jgi:Mg2+-importing ATPase
MPLMSKMGRGTSIREVPYSGGRREARAEGPPYGFPSSRPEWSLIIHVIRTRRLAFFDSRASVPLTLTTLTVCLVGIYLPYSVFATALGFVPLPWAYWPILLFMIVGYLGLTHVMKLWFHERFGLG